LEPRSVMTTSAALNTSALLNTSAALNATAALNTSAALRRLSYETQLLRVSEVFGRSRSRSALPATAMLRRVSPPVLQPDCFKSVDWYILEDISGNLATLPFKPEHWDDLKSLVPHSDVPDAGAVPGSVAVGRVHLTVCGAAPVPPSCVTPFEAQQIIGSSHDVAKECKRRALARSAGIGMFASIGACAFLVIFSRWDRKRRSPQPANPVVMQSEFPLNIHHTSRSDQNGSQNFHALSSGQNGVAPPSPSSSFIGKSWLIAASGAAVSAVALGIVLDFVFGVVLPLDAACGLDSFSHFSIELWRLSAGIGPSVISTIVAVYYAAHVLYPDIQENATRHKILIAHMETDASGRPVQTVRTYGPFAMD